MLTNYIFYSILLCFFSIVQTIMLNVMYHIRRFLQHFDLLQFDNDQFLKCSRGRAGQSRWIDFQSSAASGSLSCIL